MIAIDAISQIIHQSKIKEIPSKSGAERFKLFGRPRLSDQELDRICEAMGSDRTWKRLEHGDDSCTVLIGYR